MKPQAISNFGKRKLFSQRKNKAHKNRYKVLKNIYSYPWQCTVLEMVERAFEDVFFALENCSLRPRQISPSTSELPLWLLFDSDATCPRKDESSFQLNISLLVFSMKQKRTDDQRFGPVILNNTPLLLLSLFLQLKIHKNSLFTYRPDLTYFKTFNLFQNFYCSVKGIQSSTINWYNKSQLI